MSIYKEDHYEPSTFVKWFKGMFFGAKCDSHVKIKGERTQCTLKMGHTGKHKNGEWTWAYGDFTD
jgi:hypothetical protein